MIYTANIEVYDFYINENVTHKIILDAENWSDAINKLFNYFDKRDITSIKSFEPITDNFVYVDKNHIKEQILNEF